MDALHALHTRRSVRKFTDEPVEESTLEEIIAAGMMAPSAGNEQPWHFVVLRDARVLKAISKDHLYASVVEKVPVAILVCGDLSMDRYEGFWVEDCAAATQNMLLATHALGLGSIWVGLYPRSQRLLDIRAIIPLPEHIIPFSIVPIGHPAEEKAMEIRFDQTRIHYEKW
jgi:nitroreductase